MTPRPDEPHASGEPVPPPGPAVVPEGRPAGAAGSSGRPAANSGRAAASSAHDHDQASAAGRAAGPAGSPEGPAADLDLEELRRTVAEVLGVGPERIGDTDNLVDLGVDSVKVMAISARLRRHRVRVGYAGLVEEPSLDAWWRMISEAARAAETTGRSR